MRQKQQAGSKTSKKVNNPGSYTGKATETIKCSEMGIMGDGVRGIKSILRSGSPLVMSGKNQRG